MLQALIAIVYRVLSSGHRDRTSVAAGITIVDFQKRPCASARASQSNFLAWWPSASRLRPPAPFHRWRCTIICGQTALFERRTHRSALISRWKLAFRRSWAMVSRSRCVSTWKDSTSGSSFASSATASSRFLPALNTLMLFSVVSSCSSLASIAVTFLYCFTDLGLRNARLWISDSRNLLISWRTLFIFLFFLCPVSSGRVGSSGCAMMTPPYGQIFRREKVTVSPWREAVTFLPLSGGTDCWSGCRWRGGAAADKVK